MNGQEPTSAELISAAKGKIHQEIKDLEIEIEARQNHMKALKKQLKKLEE